jgi:uncharacterized protein (TIGR02466 family)
MQTTPIFSIGIGKASETSLLNTARTLFKDNQNLIQQGEDGLRTTLQRYNSTSDCAVLNNQKAVEKIKEAIKKNAALFYSDIGFDVSNLEFTVVNLWLNEMTSGSEHKPHAHYGFQLSGCFYVDVPEGSNLIKLYTPIHKKEHGDNHVKELNQYNAEFYGIHPEEGDMFFWESLMVHQVPELEYAGVRRSIAYDLSICKKIEQPIICNKKTESEYKMNLQDYVAIYNINNQEICKKVILELEEDKWEKHSYANPITGEHTTYQDDLDMSYQSEEITEVFQKFAEECAKDYIENVAPNSFPLQKLTYPRFNRYKVGTNMKLHHDHIHDIFDGEKKGVPVLTVLGLLNDNFEGGDFLMFDGQKVELSAGDIIVFPSNFLYPHAVTTVTKGTRYSFVSWGY